MTRDRKELAVGETAEDAIKRFIETHGGPFDPNKHEAELDEKTGLWSVYNRRKPKSETFRPVRRVGHTPYSYGKDARPIVLTLYPGELIETRLKGRRMRHVISWQALHAYLVRRDALAAMRAKQAERAERRKAKRLAKREQISAVIKKARAV